MVVKRRLIGVLLAALVVFSGQDAPLALVGPGFADAALWIGGGAFLASIAALYTWLDRLSAAQLRSASASNRTRP